MGFFNSTVEAFVQGRSICATLLVFMDFAETPRRWWPGFGELEAGGHTWLGTGELISVTGLDQPMGTGAPQTTFTLSGVDASIVTLARNASDRVKGRRVVVYVQFFDASPDLGSAQAWAALDQPVAIWSGRMDQMKYAANGPSGRSITVTAESLWVNRSRPAYGLYTNADQVARFPGDKGLEYVTELASKTITWQAG